MKTGLVLEGGALRTIYSAGVTDGFLKAGITVPYTVGVSAGIAYGVSYLSRQFGRNRDILLRYAADRRYMGFSNMLRPGNRHCYFGLDFTYRDIPDRLIPFDRETFTRECGECEAVITDIETGRAVYRTVDAYEPDMKLLQATCAMPLLFPIYDIDGIRCLDGGIADAIPWEHALERGCDRLIVVLTRERSYRRTAERLQPLMELFYRRYPRLTEAMRTRAERYNESRERLFELERSGRALIFSPDSTEGFSRIETDKQKIEALWQHGLAHSEQRTEEVRQFLKEALIK